MNPLTFNYILLLLFIAIFLKEIYNFKTQKKYKKIPVITISIFAIILTIVAISKGVPLNQLQLTIDNFFK